MQRCIGGGTGRRVRPMKPVYSIIIPAYNEEALLPRCLVSVREALRELPDPAEVIVVDNNSTDATARIALEHGACAVFEPVNQISRARNAGARAASGRYLIFLDADSLLPEGLLRATARALEEDGCSGGGVLIRMDRELPPFSRFFVNLWAWTSRNFRLAAGSFIFCRREAFEYAGGFSERLYAMEEGVLSLRVKRWGKKAGRPFKIIESPRLVTSARKLDRPLHAALALATVFVFPFFAFSRRLSWFWYNRGT